MRTVQPVIPTHRFLARKAAAAAGIVALLAAIGGAYLLAANPGDDVIPHGQAIELLAQQREQGRAEGYAEAISQMSATVADAYGLGWRAANAEACKPVPGAPL